MAVSIVIPHYGTRLLLDACLAALAEHAPEAEVVVVDDNDQGLGFAQTCNTGAERSTGDPIVFLNNDAFVHAGWLGPLVAAFDEPDVGAAGSLLLYPDGRIQHAGVELGIVNGTLTAWNITTPQPACDVSAVTGASMAVRRDVFDRLGGFDADYRNGYEDVDLSLRIRHAGWRIRYVPESVATHLESQSGPARWTHVRHNIRRLHDRWAEGFHASYP